MSRAPWLTRSEVTEIQQLLTSGLTHRQIARRLARSIGSIARVRAGLVAGRSRPLTRKYYIHWPDEDYYYGGVYGQNVSKQNWKDLGDRT